VLVKMPFNKSVVYKTDIAYDDWTSNMYDDLEDYIKSQKFLVEDRILSGNNANNKKFTIDKDVVIKMLRNSKDNGLLLGERRDNDYVFCNLKMT